MKELDTMSKVCNFVEINKQNRRIGAISEAEFIVQCLKRKFKISKPFNEDCKYDFILDSGLHVFKVQVKSSSSSDKRGYNVADLRRKRGKMSFFYTKKDIDIFAVNITNNNKSIWYFFPVEKVPKNGVIKITKNGKYKSYKENWKIFGEVTYD